jgi:hypothetical protein
MIFLQAGLVAILLALSASTAFAAPTRDHPYVVRDHPYTVTTVAEPAAPVIAPAGEGFGWDSFAIGFAIPVAAALLGVAAMTARTGRLPRIHTSS